MAFKVFVGGQEGTTSFRLSDHPSQRGGIGLLHITENKCKDSAKRVKLLNATDVAFLYLPDVVPHEAASPANNSNTCIIDASTVFRASDDWVYGLPELVQGQCECLRNTKRIAVLGCHASALTLLMCPLVDADIALIDYPVIVFSLTGYSGGGKQIVANYLVTNNLKFDNLRPYALALTHKHLSETRAQSKLSLVPIFTSVVGGFLKGLVVMIGLYP